MGYLFLFWKLLILIVGGVLFKEIILVIWLIVFLLLVMVKVIVKDFGVFWFELKIWEDDRRLLVCLFLKF